MKKFVGIATALALSFGTMACATQEEEYAAVCVDPETEVRLDDDACESGDSDFLTYAVIWWMLMDSNSRIPEVGHKVDKSKVYKALPKGARSVKVSEKGKKPSVSTGSNSGGSKSKTNKSKSSGWGSKSGGFSSGRRR